MKLIFLVSFALLSSVFAGSINGTVHEVVSKTKLIGANVILKSVDEKKMIVGTITGIDGKFQLTRSIDGLQENNFPNGKYIIEISYIGFMMIKKNIVVKNEKNIFIKAGLTLPETFETFSRY